jgi:hypothetical protein
VKLLANMSHIGYVGRQGCIAGTDINGEWQTIFIQGNGRKIITPTAQYMQYKYTISTLFV